VKTRGCCPSCAGSGASGEECTGGACWDCQATGHPHLGPCGFWLWWLNHSLDVLLVLYVYMIGFAIVMGVAQQVWMEWTFAGSTLPGWIAWLTLDRLYDRRVRAKVWNH
jgi:hypothetical protein